MKKFFIIAMSLLISGCSFFNNDLQESIYELKVADANLQLNYNLFRDQIIARKHHLSKDDWELLKKFDDEIRKQYGPIKDGIDNVNFASKTDPNLFINAIIGILPIGIELMQNMNIQIREYEQAKDFKK